VADTTKCIPIVNNLISVKSSGVSIENKIAMSPAVLTLSMAYLGDDFFSINIDEAVLRKYIMALMAKEV